MALARSTERASGLSREKIMPTETIKRFPPDFEEGVEATPLTLNRALATSSDGVTLFPPPFQHGIEAKPFVVGAQAVDVATCPISPLSTITDPLARRMEAGERLLWDGADARLRPAAERLVELVVAEPGGTATITSAFRPQPYQDHLREVWEKARDARIRDAACAAVREEVDATTA
jgi:hypothetical protein